LSTLREAGFGTKRQRELPAHVASTKANSPGAALLVREQRRLVVEQGGAGVRPVPSRRGYRLPLLVKYHKPSNVMASKRNIRSRGVEDLRSVVAMAGDRFELDLYHPVGRFPTRTSGLLLWSRSGKLTNELVSSRRGVVHVFEAEVFGVVDEQKLRQELRAGIPVGVVGFEITRYADLQQAKFLPGSSLQDPRSLVVLATRDGRTVVPRILAACGHKVAKLKRTQMGILALGDLKEGDLEAATEEEEEWACRLAGMPEEEYPLGRFPEPEPVAATSNWAESSFVDVDESGFEFSEGA